MSRIQIPRKWDVLTDYQALDYIQSWVEYLLKHHKLYRAKVSGNTIKIAGLEIKPIKTPKYENAILHSGDVYGFSVNGKMVYLHDEMLMRGNGDVFHDIAKLYNKILYRKEPLKAKVREYWIDKNMSVSLPQLCFVVVYTAAAVMAGYMAGQQSQQPEFNKSSHSKSNNMVDDTTSQTVIYGDVRDFIPKIKQDVAPVKEPNLTVHFNISDFKPVQETCFVPAYKKQETVDNLPQNKVVYFDIRDFVLQQQKQK